MKPIQPDQLTDMTATSGAVWRVDLVYARDENLLFGERIYRPDARLWLFDDLARVVMRAAHLCHERTGGRFILYDGLRTVDAQEAMIRTKRVRDNPHWLGSRAFCPRPGRVGMTRMAVDIGLEDANGVLLDMDTPFDYLAEDSSPLRNPAHRQYTKLSREAARHRNILNHAMQDAADELKTPIVLLPQEWWDFRLPPDVFNQYAPLRDADLPLAMRMMKG